jgi:hypothetical protein
MKKYQKVKLFKILLSSFMLIYFSLFLGLSNSHSCGNTPASCQATRDACYSVAFSTKRASDATAHKSWDPLICMLNSCPELSSNGNILSSCSDPTCIAKANVCKQQWPGNCALTLTSKLVQDKNVYDSSILSCDAEYDVCMRPCETLTVTKAGPGTGTVTSLPSAISCGATCSYQFMQGTQVTLTAASDATSLFSGWSGGCTGTDTCVTTLNANTVVTATFNLKPLPNVRILGSAAVYSTVQQAYDAAADGATIQAKAVTLTESLTTNASKRITLEGGYNADYSSVTGVTAMRGMITTTAGTLTISNFALQM